MVMVMYRCGLRVGEVLALKASDINPAAGTIRVLHGKGNRACVMGISASACADVPSAAASQEDRYPSPARTIASACTVLDGTAGSLSVHTDGITSPGTGRRAARATRACGPGHPGPVSGPGIPGLRFDF